jgi:hypothetical protein
MASVPNSVPLTPGVNETFTLQELPTATLEQLLLCAKLAPPAESPTPESTKGAEPTLLTVTVWLADVVPTPCAAKLKLEVLKLAKPWVAVALSDADLTPAPVETLKLPVPALVLVGEKRTVWVQLAPAARKALHVVPT